MTSAPASMPSNFQCGAYWNGTGYDDGYVNFTGAIFYPNFTYKLLGGSAKSYDDWGDEPYQIDSKHTFTYKIEEGRVVCEQKVRMNDSYPGSSSATFDINEKGNLKQFSSFYPSTKTE